jgi:hypothetical protein
MAQVIETELDEYGYLRCAQDEITLVDLTTGHNWLVPFPTLPDQLEFVWERGSSSVMPDVWHHNVLRDFACTVEVFEFLKGHVCDGLHVVARGRLDDLPIVVFQAVDVVNVVDVSRSVPHRYASGGVSYPHIDPQNESVISGRFFRAPNQGLQFTVMVADSVRDLILGRGIAGWRFIDASVADD